jgi:FkbM family methyltransferase
MIVQHDGWWWPESDRQARPVITRDVAPATKALLSHVAGRDCVIQAGGNVGVYPVALADHFRRVITVEPDPENFACLERNLRARDSLNRIEAVRGGLGESPGACRMVEVEPGNCGAHRVASGGSIPLVSIDSFNLGPCDLIWLDIEGAELSALKGAVETIEACSPVIAIEDKGLGDHFGVGSGEVAAWLQARGYAQVDRIGQDKVFRRPR